MPYHYCALTKLHHILYGKRKDTADNQQAMRSRLFLHWFYDSEISEQFIIHTAEVNDEDVTNYITLIAQRIHPNINTIIRQFDEEIQSFKEKPSN